MNDLQGLDVIRITIGQRKREARLKLVHGIAKVPVEIEEAGQVTSHQRSVEILGLEREVNGGTQEFNPVARNLNTVPDDGPKMAGPLDAGEAVFLDSH